MYFPLVSVFSGNVVTGQAAGVSGRVSADGGTQAVVAGTIAEIGGGQYVLQMFTNDSSGNILGFLFTASGCAPVSFTVMTDNNISGRIGIVSGTNVNVWSGQLSGQLMTPASGAFGTASLNSGQSVLIYSGQLSGQQINLLSGNQTQVWSGTFVNVFSGQLSGQVVTAASGAFGTASLNSGQFVNVYSGQLSGQLVSASSGLFTTASLNSGQFTLLYSGQFSGQPVNVTVASGLFVNASLNSGQFVNVYSGQLSGQQANLSSGNTVALLSGSFVNVFSGQINSQVWDQDGGVESGLTQRQALRLTTASCAGETSGAGTATFRIRNAVADFKTRITGTIDASGNRTSIAYDVT